MEADPEDQAALHELCVSNDNLQIVGWYHSHPTFKNVPSNRDIHMQHEQQTAYKECPYIGLIMGSWSSVTTNSEYKWFNIMRDEGNITPLELNTNPIPNININNHTLFQQIV